MSSLLYDKTTSAKFPRIGDRVGGQVVEDARESQQRDYDTNEPLFWGEGGKRVTTEHGPDGKKYDPAMQLVVTVDTGESDPNEPDDDGHRAIYVKGQMLQATREACRKVKYFEIKKGAFFAVTLVDEEPVPKNKKGKPKKIYTVEFRPASAGSALLSDSRSDDEDAPAAAPAAKRGNGRAAQLPEPPF